MRRVTTILAFLTTLAIVVGSTAADAISNGQPDGTLHPNVGCLLGQLPDGTFVGCGTAQLVSPTVVLLAAHEFPVLGSLGATRFFVSFDPVVDPATSKLYAASSIVVDPDYNPTSNQGEDLAVILLAKSVKGVTPIQLPTAGLLDQMKQAGSLGSQQLVVVGYGRDCTGTIPCGVGLDTTRRFATEKFISLAPTILNVQSNNSATGEGGACFGDSGSPHFLGDSNVSVGVTHAVRGNCNTAVPATRVDTASARAFLGQFVALP